MRCNVIVRGGAAASAVVFLTLAAPGASKSADEGLPMRAVIEIQLPAEAELLFDGDRTESTGEVRHFLAPPLAVGKTYIYVLKATWNGKEVIHKLEFKADAPVTVDLRPEFGAADKPGAGTPSKKGLPARDGFETVEQEGRWWIFRADSKEMADFKKNGEPEKRVTRLSAGPGKETLMAPDAATLDEYLTARPGFVTKGEDGRLWIFRSGSKELDDFKKNGDLEKHVTRLKAGSNGMTLMAPDGATIDDYLKAKAD